MTEAEYTAKRTALLDQLSAPQSASIADRSTTFRPIRDVQAAIQALDAEWQRQQGKSTARIGRMYFSGEGK